MKVNDEYDSERHMELVGKYMPGRKRKVFICEVFDSKIFLQVAPMSACNNWQAWMILMEAADRRFDSIDSWIIFRNGLIHGFTHVVVLLVPNWALSVVTRLHVTMNGLASSSRPNDPSAV